MPHIYSLPSLGVWQRNERTHPKKCLLLLTMSLSPARPAEQSHGHLKKAKYKQEIKGNIPATLLSLAQREF